MNPKHLLGCVAGIAIVAGALALAGLPVGRYLPYAALLACPAMMIAMMRMGGHGGHDHGGPKPPISDVDEPKGVQRGGR